VSGRAAGAAAYPRPERVCGKRHAAQAGVPEQVLGAITNGTLGSQTFGISSGIAG